MDRLYGRRRRYARLVAANAGVPASHRRLIEAFASVPRENFLGRPPWRVFLPPGHVNTSDPAALYEDALVALKLETRLNNGQPSLHMACLSVLAIKEGETIVHLGAGTGYYTAIIATLAGPSGKVVAFEIDADLAARAKDNLASFPSVDVRHQSGSVGPLQSSDVIYVSAGATAPLQLWTNALQPGGRLLFPLTPPEGVGCMLLVTKTPGEVFGARSISTAVFTPCVGGRDDEIGRRLSQAFATQDIKTVRSLQYGTQPDSSCWFAGPDWWLSTRS